MTISASNSSEPMRTIDRIDNQEPIKVTARFQDGPEPIRHRPIIRIEGSHIVRNSIDSGRDNPFRPDGDIYKSADPIVDYYKQAANQSRPQSPNDNSALIENGGEGNKKRRFWRKRKDDHKTSAAKQQDSTQQQQQSKPAKKSCLRRWLCCGCCSCKSRKNDQKKKPMSKEDQEIAKRLAEIANQEAEAQQKAKLGPLDAAFDANKEAYKEARRKFLRQQSVEEGDKKSGDSTEEKETVECSVYETVVDINGAAINTDVIDDNDAKNKSQARDIVDVKVENISASIDSIDKPPTVVAADDAVVKGSQQVDDGEERVLSTETTTETIVTGEDGNIATETITTTTTTSNADIDAKKEEDKDGKSIKNQPVD